MCNQTDLLGDPIQPPHPTSKGKRKNTKPNGYFTRPGSGPAGETCKTCAHRVHKQLSGKVVSKCDKARGAWTNGRGSDILASSPACSGWEPIV